MLTAPSPTGRALTTLQLLQSHPGITAAQLADRLEVSERAARRYVDMLREAGIAIRATRGRYGGYALDRGTRLPPLVFTPPEALAIVMAILDGHHDVGDVTAPVGAALDKLLRALPASVASAADAVRRTTTPAPDRAAARPDPARVAALVDASEQGRTALLTYRSEAGNSWSSAYEPWAVVVRHGRWYALCRSVRSGELRAYRVDRIEAIEPLDDPFVRPDDFDPVTALEAHLATGWEYVTEVSIEAPVERVRRLLPPTLGTLAAVDVESTRLTGTTSNPTWYAEQLAVLPFPFHIAGGDELRTATAALATRLHHATTPA